MECLLKAKKVKKTDDKIELFSKYGREFSKNLYISSLLDFKTQMTPGYNYPNDSLIISDFMSPAYLYLAAGIDYKPFDFLTAFISPITGKFTFVYNQSLANNGAFGVEPAIYDEHGNLLKKGKNSRSEIGGYIRLAFDKEILTNVTLKSKIDLFSNYLYKPQNIDIDWELLISMKINKYITVSISTRLIYDDDVMIEIDSNNDGIVDKKVQESNLKRSLVLDFHINLIKRE